MCAYVCALGLVPYGGVHLCRHRGTAVGLHHHGLRFPIRYATIYFFILTTVVPHVDGLDTFCIAISSRYLLALH